MSASTSNPVKVKNSSAQRSSHLSALDTTTGGSMAVGGLNSNSRLKGKFKKIEEGHEGLPEEFQPYTE